MKLETKLIEQLIEAAKAVRDNAYAPYSDYAVGAALLTVDGEIHTGCNVENASLGISLCAERNAVAAAVASGACKFRAIAVVTRSTPPAAPCGACRQVLAEFGDFPVILANSAGDRHQTTVSRLLPRPFQGVDLRTD
jgi:cytidine deaminase